MRVRSPFLLLAVALAAIVFAAPPAVAQATAAPAADAAATPAAPESTTSVDDILACEEDVLAGDDRLRSFVGGHTVTVTSASASQSRHRGVPFIASARRSYSWLKSA